MLRNFFNSSSSGSHSGLRFSVAVMLTASFSVRNSHQRITLSLSLSLSLTLSFYLTESEFVEILVETGWDNLCTMARSLGSTAGRRAAADCWSAGYFSYSHQIRWVRKIFTIRVLCRSLAVVRLGLLFQSKREMQERTRRPADDALQCSWSLLNTIENYMDATEAVPYMERILW